MQDVCVLVRLDYCNTVLAGLPVTTLAPLQRVLHAAAQLVLNLRPRDHVTPVLRELHWLPVPRRIEFKLCLLVHKIQLGHSSTYLSDLLTLAADVPGRPSVWSSSRGDFIVARTSRKFRDRTISVAAARAWNRTDWHASGTETLTYHATVQMQTENIFIYC